MLCVSISVQGLPCTLGVSELCTFLDSVTSSEVESTVIIMIPHGKICKQESHLSDFSSSIRKDLPPMQQEGAMSVSHKLFPAE